MNPAARATRFGTLIPPQRLVHPHPEVGMARLKRLLWHLLGGTRGGPMRIRILQLLRERPLNTNQVTRALGIDYKTAEHHMRVLRENRLVVPSGEGYGTLFLLSPEFEESIDEFDVIVAKTRPEEGA